MTKWEYQTRSIRTTGRQPDVVAASVADVAREMAADGWQMVETRPLIYNGQATGYLLLAYERPVNRS